MCLSNTFPLPLHFLKQRKTAQSCDCFEKLIDGTWQLISLNATLVNIVSLTMLKDRRNEIKKNPNNAKVNFHLAFIEKK